MKKKTAILAICAALLIFAIAACQANGGDISRVERVVGYSAIYGEDLINEACRVVERTFAEEFEGCVLMELRYDEEVENRFADLIMEYDMEHGRELIVLLSTFRTDENGGDGSFNPSDTYTKWQWHLVRTADMKSWEIISWGY